MATTESEPTTPTTKQQIDELLDTLSPRDQARVLAYARSLNELPEGVSGRISSTSSPFRLRKPRP
jgi:hypothetical protein